MKRNKYPYQATCKECGKEVEARQRYDAVIQLASHWCTDDNATRGTYLPDSLRKKPRPPAQMKHGKIPVIFHISNRAEKYFQTIALEAIKVTRSPWQYRNKKFFMVDWDLFFTDEYLSHVHDDRPTHWKEAHIWGGSWRFEEGNDNQYSIKHQHQVSLTPHALYELIKLANEHDVRHTKPGSLVGNFLEGVSLGYLHQ